jgi:hypothetical protein
MCNVYVCMYSVTRFCAETRVCVCVSVEHVTLLKLHTKNTRIVKNKPIGMTKKMKYCSEY